MGQDQDPSSGADRLLVERGAARSRALCSRGYRAVVPFPHPGKARAFIDVAERAFGAQQMYVFEDPVRSRGARGCPHRRRGAGNGGSSRRVARPAEHVPFIHRGLRCFLRPSHRRRCRLLAGTCGPARWPPGPRLSEIRSVMYGAHRHRSRIRRSRLLAATGASFFDPLEQPRGARPL
jgi:hypothetical protein